MCDKVLISGNDRFTFTDYIADKYPASCNGRSKTVDMLDILHTTNAQADALYTFQADWLKENIKFDHGSLMGLISWFMTDSIWK